MVDNYYVIVADGCFAFGKPETVAGEAWCCFRTLKNAREYLSWLKKPLREDIRNKEVRNLRIVRLKRDQTWGAKKGAE
jgi:hypothetical protein